MKKYIGKKEVEHEPKEVFIEITQAEYAEMKQKGYDEEELLPPGKHKFSRVTPDRVATREELHPSNTKVQITMKIDLDILNHFKQRAASTNSAPYQTQINSELREVMKRDLEERQKQLDETAKFLLEDEDFLNAVSQKLKEKELKAA